VLKFFPGVVQRINSQASALSGGEQKQNVKSALKMADEAIALESGRLVLHRRADEVLADPNIERLFFGGHAPAEKHTSVP
jgi:ABC-type branched-subunit amino acid transport system ATPase component